jgi:CheY-like chemotaxis protein
MTKNNEVNILVVDDDEVDVKAIRRAFNKLKIANPLTVAHDGIDALERLRGQNGYDQLPRPNMILLDLNMPRMNGIEFLAEIRNDPELGDSIVFVLTTSNDDEDKVKTFNYNVAGYIVKTDPAAGFMKAIEMIDLYWKVVELPA